MAGKRFELFTIREREGQDKAFWCKIGVAFQNKDGSYNLLLDALPLDGKLHMRLPYEKDEEEEDDRPRKKSSGKPAPKKRRDEEEDDVAF